MPAKAGIQQGLAGFWIAACAGMTERFRWNDKAIA
jgi:hypothetical protein